MQGLTWAGPLLRREFFPFPWATARHSPERSRKCFPTTRCAMRSASAAAAHRSNIFPGMQSRPNWVLLCENLTEYRVTESLQGRRKICSLVHELRLRAMRASLANLSGISRETLIGKLLRV